MEKTSKNITLFLCKICNFSCSKKGDYHRHLLTAKHQNRIILNKNTSININTYMCENCNKKYNACNSLWYHKKKCIKENTFLEKEIKEETIPINNLISEIQEISKNIQHILESKINYPINNQLINIIVDKINTISELKNVINENKIICDTIIPVELSNKELSTLNINNVIIVSRSEDNYINATQLCQAGNKHFHKWLRLDSTKLLIDALKSKVQIWTLELVEINKGGNHEGSWIHPDLAIQLAQWISPIFALQVSEWIRTLFTNGSVSTNIKLLEDHQKEINLKDQKIKLLEDAFIKKQQRKDYPEKNVIYMLTTEDNKKKRIYIIGKAKDLKNRLSVYNKTSEHEVIYYKECKSEEDMNIIETMVLNKLKEYKEKANRDRFILPLEKDIIFFTNMIDLCINF